MDCEAFGRDLSSCVMHLLAQSRVELEKTVGGDSTRTEANLLVLCHWAATKQVSDSIPAQFAQPILESMHQGMFDLLMAAGLDETEAESFVHERYAEYYDAITTREGADAMQHIGACFVGFCNPKADGQVHYSLDLLKIMPVVIQLGAVAKALQTALEELVKEHCE
jgi:hypothetical protein